MAQIEMDADENATMPFPRETILMRSPCASLFMQMGQVYLYHDLFGYLLGMSDDVARFLERFDRPRMLWDVIEDPATRLPRDLAIDFATVFSAQSCLVSPGTDEKQQAWEMYPVRGPWILGYRSAPDRLDLLSSRWDGVHQETLDGWRLCVFGKIDGNRTCRELYDECVNGGESDDSPVADDFLDTIARWVHHDRQFLRLSHHPVSQYRPVTMPMPPYLKSTMPYRPRDPSERPGLPLIERRLVSAASHYEKDERSPEDRFDLDETTLSHLFREPHAALRGRTYAQALVAHLVEDGGLRPAGARILEIGGGTGAMAAGVIREIARLWPDAIDRFTYTIADLSPALRDGQASAATDLPIPIGHLAGDAETIDLGRESWDLVLCNEMIGDLTTLRLEPHEWTKICRGKEIRGVPAEWSDLLRRHAGILREENLPDVFHLNVGALRLIERIADALAPGGYAFVSEFGDEQRFPRLSDHLDHPEFSIQYAHVRQVAMDCGLKARVCDVVDLFGFDRAVEVLGTTRGQFQALRSVAERAGRSLDKRAYTMQELADALGPDLPVARFEGLRFDRFERRVMGLAPTDFLALLAKKA